MARSARWMVVLAALGIVAGIIAVVPLASVGTAVPVASVPASLPPGLPGVDAALGVETGDSPSVTCNPFGLYGDITTPPLVGRLSEGSDNLVFLATTNGLYVVAPGGQLRHFLYSPFGIEHVAIIEDVTGDGTREVVVALGDTQVPALRCYDGANWEELWRFAPMVRIWDRWWVDCQMSITNLRVVDDGDSQSLLVTSGRCVISIRPEDGAERWRFAAPATLWRMVTLPDLNGDGASEVLVGSDGGHLVWLSSGTGRVEWRTELSRHRGVDYGDAGPPMGGIVHMVSDIAVLDGEAGLVAVASGDGSVQLYDLGARRCEWDTLVFTKGGPGDPTTSNYLLLSPTADITGDGLGELLLSKVLFDSQISDRYSGAMTNGETALCDSAGNVVWSTDGSREGVLVWPGMAFETGVFEGQPCYLDTETSAGRATALAMVDLEDGQSVLHRVPLGALSSPGVTVRQPGGDAYVSFSSGGDLAALSATGDLLWYYPRITNIEAERGSFVGDGAEDVLLRCESGSLAGTVAEDAVLQSRSSPHSGSDIRLLRMMDGATGATAWSYEVPYSELAGGGLKSVQVTADLVGGDGIRDIVGCRGDRVFIFSGRDGTASSFAAGQPVSSLEIIRNGAAGTAMVLAASETPGVLLITDSSGAPLWSTAAAEWLEGEAGTFVVLDDINSDNVSDLAVLSATRIVVLKSRGQASAYDLHRTIPTETQSAIQLPQLVADSDGDGIREMAYFQEGGASEDQYGHSGPRPSLLYVQSPEDGRCLFKADPQGTVVACDLAGGDFNGDGCPDPVLAVDFSDIGPKLRMLSGQDGSLLWEDTDYSGGHSYGGIIGAETLPAASAGDLNGDGVDDLALSVDATEYHTFGIFPRQQLQVFDVTRDAMLADIPVVSPLRDSLGSTSSVRADTDMRFTDLDADGHLEVLMAVREPSMPAYDPSAAEYSSESSPQYLALVDVDSGRRVCAFAGFDPGSVSVLPGQKPGTLAVAAHGGLCYLRIDASVQVTSPEDGASTRPNVGLSWEGPPGSSFSQVFVDGVRNDITGGFESDLYLGRGDHEIVVRSIDDGGRILYSPSDLGAPLVITVTPSPWKPAWLAVGLFSLLAVSLALAWPRLRRAWRSRRREAMMKKGRAPDRGPEPTAKGS